MKTHHRCRDLLLGSMSSPLSEAKCSYWVALGSSLRCKVPPPSRTPGMCAFNNLAECEQKQLTDANTQQLHYFFPLFRLIFSKIWNNDNVYRGFQNMSPLSTLPVILTINIAASLNMVLTQSFVMITTLKLGRSCSIDCVDRDHHQDPRAWELFPIVQKVVPNSQATANCQFHPIQVRH